MKITDGEKLILLMLCELYDRLGVEGETDPDFLRSAIFSENIWSIPWKYPGIPFEDQKTPEIVKETLDILDMWSVIENSYQNLTDKEKVYLEKEAHPFGKNPQFPGFDGNNESEYMSTASFVVNDLDRFEEFKGRIFNSHYPTLEKHKRMLSVFKSLVSATFAFEPFSVEQLASLLNASAHPDYKKDQSPS